MKLKTSEPAGQELTSSQAGSRNCASLFPKQGKEKAQKMTATCGQRCSELFNLQNRNGSSLKMFADYLLCKADWYSNKCALTWKEKITKSNRLLFQLSPSTLRTEGIGSGLLPTAQASDPTQGSVIGKNDTFYETKTGMPRKVNKNGTDGSVRLPRLINLLKTPCASEGVGGAKTDDKYWNAKAPKLKMRDQVGRKTGLKLQPNFVEWMMGYPQNWTSLAGQKADTELKD